ncbi:hypothetical protein [Rhizobium leguminosarum]
MAKPALIELRENAIESAGILENIFGDGQKIDWPAVQNVADDASQTIEKSHDTPLGSFAVHHKRLHLLNEPQMNKGHSASGALCAPKAAEHGNIVE